MGKRGGFDRIPEYVLHKDREMTTGQSSTIDVVKKAVEKPKIIDKIERLVDPARCRPWDFADRDAIWFDEKNCSDLIHGFKTIGQDTPVTARPIKGDPDFDFEIIVGARRRWTAEYLGMKLRLELTTATNAEAAIKMDAENDDRKDISPFERACSYKKFLDQKLFASGRQLAEARNIGQTFLAELLKAARIKDTSLMELINDPRELPIKPCSKLMAAWEKDDETKGAILACAAILKSKGEALPTAKIIKLLLDATKDKPAGPIKKEYSCENGKVWVKAENKKGQLVLNITPSGDGINKRDLKKLINQAVADFT